jgi:hypothetical protein
MTRNVALTIIGLALLGFLMQAAIFDVFFGGDQLTTIRKELSEWVAILGE